MTIKEKVFNAVTELSPNVDFEEILEHLYFLYKVEAGLQQVVIQQNTSKREAINLVQEGQKKVLLSLELFQNLIGTSDHREQLSVAGFADISRQLFTTFVYDSAEKIIQLLHEVKEEIAVEREVMIKKKLNVSFLETTN